MNNYNTDVLHLLRDDISEQELALLDIVII